MLLTAAALLIHGYHLGTDDAAIWVPAIKKAAHPSLYPFSGEFFLQHAHLSLFPPAPRMAGRRTALDQQVRAESGWDRFSPGDFQKLARCFPVTWIITRRSAAGGLDCPYRNAG